MDHKHFYTKINSPLKEVFWLFEKPRGRKGETSWGWARLKAGAQKSIQVEWQRSQYLGHVPLLSRDIIRELDHREAAGT